MVSESRRDLGKSGAIKVNRAKVFRKQMTISKASWWSSGRRTERVLGIWSL